MAPPEWAAVPAGPCQWWRRVLRGALRPAERRKVGEEVGDADTDVHLVPLPELEARMGVRVKEGLMQVRGFVGRFSVLGVDR